MGLSAVDLGADTAHHAEAGDRLVRRTPYDYGDGVSSPGGSDRPSARAISNRVSNEVGRKLAANGTSDMFWLWGQFVDHDIDLTNSAQPVEPFDIDVPKGDPFFDPAGDGLQTISLNRSKYDHDTGHGLASPREQINDITALIDGSNIYGSTPARAAALRTNDGTGKLRTSAGKLLPFNEGGLANQGGPSPELFLAGDVRANEHIALTAMHTLWLREHNRQARVLRNRKPELSGDVIYRQARARVAGIMQAITYNEFLPLLLGPSALPPSSGFDPAIDPGIFQEFSTAAFRFGHSMVSRLVKRLGADGLPIAEGNLRLSEAFFAPHQLTRWIGIEPYLRGAAANPARAVDARIVDELRNFLFGPPGSGGLDLAALNIQRGRDHGLADYNTVRKSYGLRRVPSFAEIGDDSSVTDGLRELYRGHINNVDVWIAGLAETHERGAMVGQTFQAILVDQFTRLRDGDPDFYTHRFSGNTLVEIDTTTLADVIRRNTTIDGEIYDDVFRVSGPGE